MTQIRGSLLLQKNVTGEDHQNKFGTILLKKKYFSVPLSTIV